MQIQNGANFIEMWTYFGMNFIKKTYTLVAPLGQTKKRFFGVTFFKDFNLLPSDNTFLDVFVYRKFILEVPTIVSIGKATVFISLFFRVVNAIYIIHG